MHNVQNAFGTIFFRQLKTKYQDGNMNCIAKISSNKKAPDLVLLIKSDFIYFRMNTTNMSYFKRKLFIDIHSNNITIVTTIHERMISDEKYLYSPKKIKGL